MAGDAGDVGRRGDEGRGDAHPLGVVRRAERGAGGGPRHGRHGAWRGYCDGPAPAGLNVSWAASTATATGSASLTAPAVRCWRTITDEGMAQPRSAITISPRVSAMASAVGCADGTA